MPKLSRLIRRSLLSLAALLLLYGAAVWLLPHIKSPGQPEGEPEITVWLLSNGVHTDIVVPTFSSEADWRAVFPAEHTRSQEYAPWLAIGLGDKNFYLTTPTWADLRLSTALKAMHTDAALWTITEQGLFHHHPPQPPSGGNEGLPETTSQPVD